MAKILRSAWLITVYLVALLVIPGAYTEDAATPAAGAAQEEAPAPTPTPEESPTETAAPEPSPTVDPTPTLEPEPSGQPAPEPSPEPTPSEAEAPVEALAAEDLSLDLIASPETVGPGESTTITALLTNNSTTGAEGVDLTILLPAGLDYLSSSPAADGVSVRPGGIAITFNSLDVPGEGSVAPSIRATPGEDAKKSLAIEGSAVWTEGEASDRAIVHVETPETTLRLTTSGGGFLKAVGGRVSYDITVKNTGEDPAEDVTIVNLVPSEVHVTGAGLAPGVDAVQVGNSGGNEDVVWVINELDVGESITVNYTGAIQEPGDLQAVNRTRASSSNAGKDSSEERTYLATTGGGGSSNPTFDPIRKKHVTRHKVVTRPLIRKRVPTEPDAPVGSAGAGELPFTGVDPLATITFGMVLIALGWVLVHATSVHADRRRIAVGSLALLLVAGACMTNGGDEKVEPRVLGTQLTRSPDAAPADDDPIPEGDPGDDVTDPDNDAPDEDAPDEGPADGDNSDGADGRDEAGDTDGSADPDATDGADGSGTTTVLVPGDPVTTFERDVDIITITADDLAVVDLASARGSTLSFGWDDGARAVTQATSSQTTVDDVADLSAQISTAGPGMKLTVSVTNVSEDTVLHVDGRLAVGLSAGGGSHMLEGPALDEDLNPGGSSSASFSFRLPSGAYSATASFLAS